MKLTPKQFKNQMDEYKSELETYLKESNKLGKEILKGLEKIKLS